MTRVNRANATVPAIRAQFLPLRQARASHSHTATWIAQVAPATTTSLLGVIEANGFLAPSMVSTAQMAKTTAYAAPAYISLTELTTLSGVADCRRARCPAPWPGGW